MTGASQKRIYLDHAAATPVDSRVREIMAHTGEMLFANPSALHQEGLAARRAIENARQTIAERLGAHDDEIVFTSGGTEANNLAVFGVPMRSLFETSHSMGTHVIISRIEHPSVWEGVQALEREGVSVTYLPVNEGGFVDPKDVEQSLRANTVLVSVIYANNEIGTVQPIAEIAKVIRKFRKEKQVDGQVDNFPLFHTDACQALAYLDMNVARLGVDMMTINGQKIYGPKGVGALFVRRGIELTPLFFGGGQEKNMRSGTENTAGIVGFAEAIQIADEMKEAEAVRVRALRDRFIDDVLHEIPGAVLNGSREDRLPNNVNFSFPGHDAEELVLRLDAKGVAVSARSACSSENEGGSYVVRALGRGDDHALSSVRFTLGRGTTEEDVAYVTGVLKEIIVKN